MVKFIEYAADKVQTLYPSTPELREQWAGPEKRSEIIRRLEERGIDFDNLATAANHPEADPFNLLYHIEHLKFQISNLISKTSGI